MQSPIRFAPSRRHCAAKRLVATVGAALILLAFTCGVAVAAPPNRVLSDEVLRDYDSMSAADIQAYLDRQPGPLKNLVTSDYDTTITLSATKRNVNLTPDTDGVKKRASLIIWEACQQWHINPKVMLAMLQKEQSLLTRTSLKSTTLARAIGAGCPDGISNRYPGFGNQMWHGAMRLDGYGELGKAGPTIVFYYPGIRVLDIYRKPKVTVYPYSIATWKLYIYNPSIGGNTSFWNIYNARFGNPLWPAVTRPTSTRISGPSSLKSKRTLTLSGAISHSGAPGSVTISKSRLVGGKWKSAGSARVGLVDGSYRYSFTPTKKGTWRFVASYSGGETASVSYRPSASRFKSVKVK
jgi:hypothetical protein